MSIFKIRAVGRELDVLRHDRLFHKVSTYRIEFVPVFCFVVINGRPEPSSSKKVMKKSDHVHEVFMGLFFSVYEKGYLKKNAVMNGICVISSPKHILDYHGTTQI